MRHRLSAPLFALVSSGQVALAAPTDTVSGKRHAHREGDEDPLAVLDARFRVRVTGGLRVADASVFPNMPGFFIVVPIYMMSEKATDAASAGERLADRCASPLACSAPVGPSSN